MSLKDIDWKMIYKSPEDDVVHDFLIPALEQSVYYDRAVGFFSSSAFAELVPGIRHIVDSDGKIRIICSPRLSQQDIDAINRGYEAREKKIHEALKREITVPKSLYEQEQYNLLAHLIADGFLDIKVALTWHNNEFSLFHVKLGILQDRKGNILTFTGSMNDSDNAYNSNIEHIDVFNNFHENHEADRCRFQVEEFERFWRDKDPTIYTISFPDDLISRIQSYKKDYIDWELLEDYAKKQKSKKRIAKAPDNIQTREYQQHAIDKWRQQNFRGIYDMATGTGKTLAAIFSILELLKYVKNRLAVIIVVPYQHLVQQWGEDLDKFGIQYISGYSGAKPRNWKSKYEKEVFNYSHGIIPNLFFLTTNASFRTPTIQKILSEITGDALLIVDEAHNFGSKKLLNTLDERFKYRLALSATLDRKYDEQGSKKLREYFGDICLSYPLERAIKDGMLTQYYYYPIPVTFTEAEREQYYEISEKIRKMILAQPELEKKKNKALEMLLIKRSRIIASAVNKLKVLRNLVAKKLVDKDHILIYCGSTNVLAGNDHFEEVEDTEIRQINAVSHIMNEEFNITTSTYTSEENAEERNQIKHLFEDGIVKAIAAIRCLDEGVNIPSIETAVILASSTNPKEYIQRRGRVLRTFPGKKYAYIFDLVTIPKDIDDIPDIEHLSLDKGLVKRELTRVKEFAEDSINPQDSDRLIFKLQSIYGYLGDETKDDKE